MARAAGAAISVARARVTSSFYYHLAAGSKSWAAFEAIEAPARTIRDRTRHVARPSGAEITFRGGGGKRGAARTLFSPLPRRCKGLIERGEP